MSSGLNIAALSQRTGVAPDTLRKWEQRYQILRPMRTAGGQRRDDERDVARVEWLCERLREGYRIGEAASLLGTTEVSTTRTADDHLRTILAAVDAGDAAQIGLLVDQAFALHGVDETLERILRPLLETIGERWHGGELTVAEEHLVTEAVRSRLGHLLADAGGGVRGTAVLACPAGERHELGLMMLAIGLRRDGWKVVYLGADTPVDDAVGVARKQAASVLAISCTVARPDVPAADGLEILVGGPAARAYTGDLTETVNAIRAFAT